MDYSTNISNEAILKMLNNAKRDNVEKYVVGAVIIIKNKILLLKRCSDEFMGGLVELPSGNVDIGETLLDGLVREVKEETGLNVCTIEKYIDFFDYTSSSGKKSRQYNFIVTVQQTDVILNPSEHDWFGWVDLDVDTLKKHNISKHTMNIIKCVF